MLVMRTPTALNPPLKSSLLLPALLQLLLKSSLSLPQLCQPLKMTPSPLPPRPLSKATTRKRLLQPLQQQPLPLHHHPVARITSLSLVVLQVKATLLAIGIAARHHAVGQIRLMLVLPSKLVLPMVSSSLMPMNR